MDFLPTALKGLDRYNQFILYKLEESKTRIGKMDKIPIHYLTKKTINPLDCENWTDFDSANTHCAVTQGIGFVFTKDDPFWFLDIDECIIDGGWSEVAITLLGKFNGAAIEISSSNKGIHIFGSGVIPQHTCRNQKFKLEFYSENRFVALTGVNAIGNIDFDASYLLPEFIKEYFNSSKEDLDSEWWSIEPSPQWNGYIEDDELLKLAIKSKSIKSSFNEGACFKELWEGDVEALSKYYPDSRDSGYNESSADLALAIHLAFWTGNHAERIYNLMLKSGLVREKWERISYIKDTIRKACGLQKEFHVRKNSGISITTEISKATKIINNRIFFNAEDQLELFKECVYIVDSNKILIPGGEILDKDRFRIKFGGRTFMLDNRNEKVTRSAWEAFTESQLIEFPKVASTIFRPRSEANSIIEEEGKLYVNSWSPPKIKSIEGDCTLFLNHIKNLLPDEKDQIIFLSYLAGLVQYPGFKFRYCIVIQGVEGNGKTFFTECIEKALGNNYCFRPTTKDFNNRFNSYLEKSLFIAVEDSKIDKQDEEIIEALKPILSDSRYGIEGKNKDKRMCELYCNFIFTTNHKNGIAKIKNDRRFCHFYTAQQNKEDLIRDNMSGNYFRNLYEWSKNEDGFHMITSLLKNYNIPKEFNPIYQDRAPSTSSTESAIKESLSNIEHEIVEAIDQGLYGFKNGWISSMAIDKLLYNLRIDKKVPRNKRRSVLKDLGYDWHTGLVGGRCTTLLLQEGGKPSLFIHESNPQKNISNPTEIINAYVESQK